MTYRVLLNNTPLADQSGATEFHAIDTAKVLTMDTILAMGSDHSNVGVNALTLEHGTDFICHHHGGVDIVTLETTK